MDATFERIQKIIPIENADNLETAIVSNYPCVVRKGEFEEGDLCFYIHDDAKILGFDEKKDFVGDESNFKCKFPWQTDLLKYLGGGGRVRSCRLRGTVSMGILLRPETVSNSEDNKFCCFKVSEENYEGINSLIKDSEKGKTFLENNFGIVHWEAPIGSVGMMNVAYQGLPEGLSISDEENYENLTENDLRIGSKCLVTKKYDGSSATVTCYPDGKYEVSCRRMTFSNEEDESKMNAYQKLTRGAAKAGLWWAKKHGETIAFRGEVCCTAFNKSTYNMDCRRNDFFIYGVNFPEKKNWYENRGLYGTKFHFLNILKECNKNGFSLKHVDVLETDVKITKDLLKKYNDVPLEFGEGVVLNVKVEDISVIPSSPTWHYKSKSREYLMKMK